MGCLRIKYDDGIPAPKNWKVFVGGVEKSEAYRYDYQGQFAEKDGETGLHHFELRQWDARIGRWNSTDPYGQHFSPYMGMGNNPVMSVDPDGGLEDWYMNLETGNVEWLFTSDQVDGYAWIGDGSMSFGDAVSIAGDWASSTNFLSEITLSESAFIGPPNQFETGGGMVNSFSASFAFMGGYTIEVGKVSDDDGNSKRFLSHGPTIGFGLSASYNLHEIRSSHSRKFTLDMYEGDASGYDVGYGLLGGYYGGDLPLDINSSDGFRKFGENYYERGLSGVASKGPKFGAWWSKTNTITFD